MREIKFRAWDKGLRKWFYLDLQQALINQTADARSKPEDWSDWQQYTGLKDKNGKEIYEGDLIDFTHKGKTYRCEIKFTNGAFCHHDFKGGWGELWNVNTICEIIGNIYENPELLAAK